MDIFTWLEPELKNLLSDASILAKIYIAMY